jgi:sigma-B regulation protein RsbU (phosphoserine phosphatase)
MRILIADDDEHMRLVLQRTLTSWDHSVIEASSGTEAWSILNGEKISVLITDWMMPDLDGPELCRKIRNHNFENYIYIILLTSRQSREDLIIGMDSGADDFMVKPFWRDELYVRLRAAERILKLENSLIERNNVLLQINTKLENAYMRIRNDLELAGNFQKLILPEPKVLERERLAFDWIFIPSDFVAGDVFNYFHLDETHIGIYLLDVSGHGVASSMLSFQLNRQILPSAGIRSDILYDDTETGERNINSPARVAAILNSLHYKESDLNVKFITMIYGVIDTETNRASFVQAGHPPPILLSRSNEVRLIKTGGPAIGIFPDAQFTEVNVSLSRGDRIYLYSDGIIECRDRTGVEYSEERLISDLRERRGERLEDSLSSISENLLVWLNGRPFDDDISLLGIEIL